MQIKGIVLVVIILHGIFSNGYSQNQNVLNIGDKAPGFSATADDGSTWDLKNYLGKKNIIVYFYPAAMTGGCTKQACAYRDRPIP